MLKAMAEQHLSLEYIPALVSVIIPAFNCELTLKCAIESVLGQSYAQLELIVVDDCSTDNTQFIVLSYKKKDPRVKYFRFSKNAGGPARPRNFGMMKSHGEYIAFLDSDDIWHPEKLSIQLDLLNRFKSDFCFSNVMPFVNEIEIEKLMLRDICGVWAKITTVNYFQLAIKNVIKSGSSVILKRISIGSCWFPEDPIFVAIEDYFMWLQLHRDKIINSCWVKQDLVFYRISKFSISSDKLQMIKKTAHLHNWFNGGGVIGHSKTILCLLTYSILSILLIIHYKLKRFRNLQFGSAG